MVRDQSWKPHWASMNGDMIEHDLMDGMDGLPKKRNGVKLL